MPILTEAMQRLVREQRLGYVATVSDEGTPNVSPKGSLTVLDEDTLVLADVESPSNVRNLATNPRAGISVVDPFARRGFDFRGRATGLHAATTYRKVLERYRAEGADIRRIRSGVVVAVGQAPPLVSSVDALGTEEDEVRTLWQEYYAKGRDRTVLDLAPPRDF